MNNTGTKQVKDELEDTKNTVTEKVDQIKEQAKTTTGQLAETAINYKEKVGELAQQGLEKANQLKQQAANVVGSSTDYVKNFDFEDTKQQFRKGVSKQPELSIVIAGAVGLIIGLLVARRRS